MSPTVLSLLAFTIVFAAGFFGMALRTVLPPSHLTAESKDFVRLGVGLVATMAALVLGLLISSAKSSFDTQSNELTDMSSRIVLLDRVLAHYGAEAQGARVELRVSSVTAYGWVSSRYADLLSANPSLSGEILYDKIQALTPKDDIQRSIQTEALNLVIGLGQIRWLIAAQRVNPPSPALLLILIFWLTIIFTSFGLFAPRNGTVIVTFLVCALSVSAAIFLILELYSPYSGFIHVSTAPLSAAISHLGQ